MNASVEKIGLAEPAVWWAGVGVEFRSGVPHSRQQHQPLGDVPAGPGQHPGMYQKGVSAIRITCFCVNDIKIAS